MTLNCMICAENLVKRFGDHAVVDDVSFDVALVGLAVYEFGRTE